MTTYFISRHQGAVDWVASQNIDVDVVQAHLDVSKIMSNDVVIGNLPINLVAEICERGAEYVHLTITVPEHLRGKELSEEDLKNHNASLEKFSVNRLKKYV